MAKVAVLYGKRKESSTVYDNIMSFEKYSKNTIVYFDIFTTKFSQDLLKAFDVIVVHYTVTIFDNNRMPPELLVLLRNITAKKIVFIQDEYRYVNRTVERLAYMKIDVLFTVISRS